MAVLASSSVIPADGDGGPKDACDRQIESGLQKSFDASALALRVASANLLMARATMSWIEDYQNSAGKLPKDLRNLFKKLSLAAGFAADSSLDALQFSAKAMASNVVAQWNVWLQYWDVDQGSQSRLLAFPFLGGKAFWPDAGSCLGGKQR